MGGIFALIAPVSDHCLHVTFKFKRSAVLQSYRIFLQEIDVRQSYSAYYAPNFEKVDGAYCFWSVRGCVRGWVGACVGGSHFLYLL